MGLEWEEGVPFIPHLHSMEQAHSLTMDYVG